MVKIIEADPKISSRIDESIPPFYNIHPPVQLADKSMHFFF